jgi:hypothetical protein
VRLKGDRKVVERPHDRRSRSARALDWVFPYLHGRYWGKHWWERERPTGKGDPGEEKDQAQFIFNRLSTEGGNAPSEIAKATLEHAEAIAQSAVDRAAAADRRATIIASTVAIAASFTLSGGGLVLDNTKWADSDVRRLFALFLCVTALCFVVSAGYALLALVKTRTWNWSNPKHLPVKLLEDLDTQLGMRAAHLLQDFAGNWEISDLKNRLVDRALFLLLAALGGIMMLAALLALDAGSSPSADLQVRPSVALSGQPVTLDASKSAVSLGPVSVGEIVTYRWDIDGDGEFDARTPYPRLTHTFRGRTSAAARVVVTTKDGQTANAASPVDIRPAPPEGPVGVSVNDGDVATNHPNVRLALTWPPGTVSALVANNPRFRPSEIFPVGPTLRWRLSPSGPESRPKTVHVRFKPEDPARKIYTDDILLDTTRPTITLAVRRAAAAVTTSSHPCWRRITLVARDSVSGVALIEVAAQRRHNGTIIRVARRKRLGRRRVARTIRVHATSSLFVRARDAAGNYSRWRTVRPSGCWPDP